MKKKNSKNKTVGVGDMAQQLKALPGVCISHYTA